MQILKNFHTRCPMAPPILTLISPPCSRQRVLIVCVATNTGCGFVFFFVSVIDSRPECVNPSFLRCKLEAVIIMGCIRG